MKHDEFWNSTLPEAIASIDGYLKRNEDLLFGIRKMCWYAIIPWMEQNARGSEYDLFPITSEEVEEWKKRSPGVNGGSVVEQLLAAKEILKKESELKDNS